MKLPEKLTYCTLAFTKKLMGLEKDVKLAYLAGYEMGHNDTVESNYGYQEDKADEYVDAIRSEFGKGE